MQVTGGGVSGPVGRRSQGSLERLLAQRRQEEALRARSDVGTARGGSYDPELQRKNDTLRSFQDDYTPMDFAKQVYEFPGKVYDDADQQVRGLLGLIGQTGSNVLNDQTPFEGIEGDAIVGETIDNWTHPMDYANEHPFAFMGDLAGAAGLGGAAINRAAGLRGVSPATWLNSEEGAIGKLGKLLEEQASQGNEIQEVSNLTSPYGDDIASMVPAARTQFSPEYPGGIRRVTGSATAPELGLVRDFDKPDFSLLKPDSGGWSGDQVSAELAVQELNNEVAKRLGLEEPPVRMPGSARGNFDYYGIKKHGGGSSYTQKEFDPNAYWTAGDEGITPSSGLVQEYLMNARDVKNNPVAQNIVEEMRNAEDMQNISIMDYIAANADRSLEGQNLMEEGGRPVAIDWGMGFRRDDPDLKYDPSAYFTPTNQQWPGLKLNDRHRAILQAAQEALMEAQSPFTAEGALKPYNAIYENIGEEGIGPAIQRIEAALNRDTLYDMNGYDHGQVGMNAWDDIEQPGEVFDPKGMQDLLNAVLNDESPEFSSEVPHSWDSGPDTSEGPDILDEFTTLGPDEIPNSQPVDLNGLLALLKQQIPGI